MNKMRHLLLLSFAVLWISGCIDTGRTETADADLTNRPSCGDEDHITPELLSTCLPEEDWTSTELKQRYSGLEALVIDSKGNIYVGGTDYNGENMSVVYKYDRYGREVATIAFGGGRNPSLDGHGIRHLAVDSNDNVFALGYTHYSTGIMDLINVPCAAQQDYLAKISANGELMWVKWANPCADAAFTTTFAVGPNDRLYLAGVATLALPGQGALRVGPAHRISDAYLRILDNDGSLQATTMFETSMWDTPTRIAFDPEGNVFVAGFTQTDFHWFNSIQWTTSTALALNKFSANGNHLWGKQLGGRIRNDGAVAIDVNSGRVAVIATTDGHFDGHGQASSPSSADFAIAVFDSVNGNKLWSRQTPSPTATLANDIKLDPNGNMHVLGKTIQISPNGDPTIGYQVWRSHLWKFANNGQILTRQDLFDGEVENFATRMSVMPDGALVIHAQDLDHHTNSLFRIKL